MNTTYSGSPLTLGGALAMASNLVRDGDEISAVHVILGLAPSEIELAIARKRAAASGVDFRFDAPGELTVWANQPEPDQPGASWTSLHRLHWPQHHRLHLPAWNLGFPSLSEGTR